MVCAQLAAPRFGSERLSFKHYELVDWLMGRDLSGEAPGDRARAVVALLRGRHRPFRRHNDGFDSNAFDLGPSYRLLIWLIRRVMPEMFFPHRGIGQNSRFRAPISVVHAPAVPGATTIGELPRFRRAAMRVFGNTRISTRLTSCWYMRFCRIFDERTLVD